MPQSVYLDSNCFAYALGQPVPNGWTPDGIRNLHDAIAAALHSDRIVIYGSEFHIEEASRISDPDSRRRFYTFFWNAVKWYVLLPTYDHARPRRWTSVISCPFELIFDRIHVRTVNPDRSRRRGLFETTVSPE